MKQTATTILLGLLPLISFSMGHASSHVHEFWSEPNVLWIVFVLPTGNLIQIFVKSLVILSMNDYRQ